MAHQSKRATRKKRATQDAHPARPKLDPRLALLISLSKERRRRLKRDEDDRIHEVMKRRTDAVAEYERSEGAERERAGQMLRDVDRQLFAPLTAGLFIPGLSSNRRLPSSEFDEPFISALILSDASSDDLRRLGVRVRSKVGDVFSAFVPVSVISKLEKSPAIRFIELSRPLFPALDDAIPSTHIDALHNASPAVDGTGVIIGIFDTVLDFYHDDFRTIAGSTRVLYLWDQTLSPVGTEAGPPTAPALPYFTPQGGMTYGVEYDRAAIDNELNSYNPPTTPAYLTVRHGGSVGEHGTHVTGIASGNGRAEHGKYVGAAPAADIIFVASPALVNVGLFADTANMIDAFTYIFSRAAQLGRPCVINMSNSDNQGPHDGAALGERALDDLLLTPGRAITLSAGNSNNTAAHAAGKVMGGNTTSLFINYRTADLNGDGVAETPNASDDIEIWYDGLDRFNVVVTLPTAPATIIGPVAPGSSQTMILSNGVQVVLTSTINDPRNGDNFISIIFVVPAGQNIPIGDTKIDLIGSTVINGAFQAWVDRNNRGLSAFKTPFLRENEANLGVPSTARRPITVGNHEKGATLPIQANSARGPTRDGRLKPEIATVGTSITAPRSRNMNAVTPGDFYISKTGTSMSAPLVAGVCALLFQCRGATSTWANLKQILEDTAVSALPQNAFGFGYMQVETACAVPSPNVDVWLRDDASDTGIEPFTGAVAWLSPDIEMLDLSGNPVLNPAHDPTKRFSNIVRVTVRNRGLQSARNTEVYLYWSDPATNIPYPSAWNMTGIYTGKPEFLEQGNMIVIPELAAGMTSTVEFGWEPPLPGSNIRGDDHFCLLARLENSADPSRLGFGGWSTIAARNNVALKNLHVQPTGNGDSVMSFYVVGSSDQDSLTIYQNLVAKSVSLTLPIEALPWRDLGLIERYAERRLPFGYHRNRDPLASTRAVIEKDSIPKMTDISGAEGLKLNDGLATVTVANEGRLHIPYVHLVNGARMIASIHVCNPKASRDNRFVHIAQHSGGQLVGGVSLELRPKIDRNIG